MTADFYYNHSDPIYVNKTIAGVHNNVSIYYKDDTDLLHPVFKVNNDKNIDRCNYVYVHNLNRYYYVDDITYKQDYIELKCTVDVLMSFKEEIKEQSCIISRSQNYYNLYLSDDKMRTESQSRIITLPFQNGFSKNSTWVLALSGGGFTSNE